MEIDHQLEHRSFSNEESNGDMNGVEICALRDIFMSLYLNNIISQPTVSPCLHSNSEHEEAPSEEKRNVFRPYLHRSPHSMQKL